MLKIQRIERPIDFRRLPEVTRSLNKRLKRVLTKKRKKKERKKEKRA
jgi:hypothetical protein